MTLLESNVDKMPLISLLEDVGNGAVSIHRGHLAKGRRTGVCGELWSGGFVLFMYVLRLFGLYSFVSRFLTISSFFSPSFFSLPVSFRRSLSFQDSHEKENPRIIDSSHLKTKI